MHEQRQRRNLERRALGLPRPIEKRLAERLQLSGTGFSLCQRIRLQNLPYQRLALLARGCRPNRAQAIATSRSDTLPAVCACETPAPCRHQAGEDCRPRDGGMIQGRVRRSSCRRSFYRSPSVMPSFRFFGLGAAGVGAVTIASPYHQRPAIIKNLALSARGVPGRGPRPLVRLGMQ